MINYGNAIKRIRIELGIKQKEIAERTGLSVTYLSLVENNKANPSMDTLNEIADAMDIPLEILIWDAIDLPEILSQEQKKAFILAKGITSDIIQNIKKGLVK